MSTMDLLVVGAGPAGMAAAAQARLLNLDVMVVDDQALPGGQIWRSIETVASSPRFDVLGESYRQGLPLVRRFRESGAHYTAGAQLWAIESGFRAFVTQAGQASTIDARAILLATGAQERPVPFPGWTLPGVLTVGAAQIMLKSAGQIPSKPVWIAGSGPLPLLYMTQLIAAGGTIAGYLDTTPPGRRRTAMRYALKAFGAWGEIAKGLGWMRVLRKAGVRIVRHVSNLKATGTGQLQALTYRSREGDVTVPAEVLLVHEGVVPSIHAALSLGCATEWSDEQDCFVPVLNGWGESTQEGVFIAGDGAGIAGAKAAVLRGELAALGIASALGRISRGDAEQAAVPLRRQLARELAVRPLLDALFKPRAEIFVPSDDTIVCRCEELTAGDIRRAAAAGQPGPNQVKAFTRAGMGPCQGRQCGYTINRILSAMQGRSPGQVGFYRVRPPLKPVTLGELASLEKRETPA